MGIITWLMGTQLGRLISAVGAVLVVLGMAFLKGRAAGVKAQKEKQERAEKKALEKFKELENEVDGLSDDALNQRGGRWLRDKQS